MENRNEIIEAIALWEKKYKPVIDSKKNMNLFEVFEAIYAFRYVVETIDEVNQKNATAYKYEIKEVLEVVNGELSEMRKIMIAIPETSSVPRLITEWSKLDDIHFTENQIEKLALTKDDIQKMRLANYKGFIDRIILKYCR